MSPRLIAGALTATGKETNPFVLLVTLHSKQAYRRQESTHYKVGMISAVIMCSLVLKATRLRKGTFQLRRLPLLSLPFLCLSLSLSYTHTNPPTSLVQDIQGKNGLESQQYLAWFLQLLSLRV